MATIKLKNGSGAPSASDLVQGEPAFDLTNKRLYTEDSGGNVIEVGVNPTEMKATYYKETYAELSGTTPAVTCTSANVFYIQLSGATTFTFASPPTSGTAYGFTLEIKQDGSGSAYTVNFPASVKWAYGIEPSLSTAANATDIFTFYTHDSGTTWYGFLVGKNMSTP